MAMSLLHVQCHFWLTALPQVDKMHTVTLNEVIIYLLFNDWYNLMTMSDSICVKCFYTACMYKCYLFV